MRISIFFLLCYLLPFSSEIHGQSPSGEIFLCFYNVENLFDLSDDPKTADEEFTPRGVRRWTYQRFRKKLLDISKVFMNAAGWEPPQLIVLCEIENRYVLEQLIGKTPLKECSYKMIHKDSPDARGTDVALLYRPDVFYPLHYRYFPLRTASDSLISSREILYVCGILNAADTLHLFANHWPSRYTGLLESQPYRNRAAKILREQVEIIQNKHANPRIVITGDFNDQPTDESVSVHLKARGLPSPCSKAESDLLYNLSRPWTGHTQGTLKYRSQWSVFDQIIVSGSLLNDSSRLYTRPEWARIVTLPFLLEKDERYGGVKTRRTYAGFRYNSGVSDHLPVLLKLKTGP